RPVRAGRQPAGHRPDPGLARRWCRRHGPGHGAGRHVQPGAVRRARRAGPQRDSGGHLPPAAGSCGEPGPVRLRQRHQRGLRDPAGAGGRQLAVLQPGLAGVARRGQRVDVRRRRAPDHRHPRDDGAARDLDDRGSAADGDPAALRGGRRPRPRRPRGCAPGAAGAGRGHALVGRRARRFAALRQGNLYDGMGPTLTVGVDWASGNVVYGAFAGYGTQAMDWGLRRGSFDQADASLGGYVGWRSGNLWANGQLSYTWLDFDTDREVQLGQATRVHSGSAEGSNVTLGASAGFDFGEGAFRHGPVVSLLSQQIDIDGFAESDPALSSSLAYPKQSFDSLIGSVGWQFRYQPSDRIQPYARVTWDVELEDEPAQAFAISQSVPQALPCAVPG